MAETTLARVATTATPEDVDRVGDRILAHLDPDGTLPDERDRTRRRGLTLTRQDRAGMSTLTGCLTPTARAMLDAVLAKWARPGMNNPTDPDSPTGTGDSVAPAVLAAAAARDTRTEAQRNHDAFEAMARVLLETGTLGTHRGLPVTVLVTMTIDQLEHAAGGVATTATGGTLPIADALHLARRAHPVLVVFDHHGRPLHLGRERRLASADQRLALIAADGGCTRPGCDAPASRCAVHHVDGLGQGWAHRHRPPRPGLRQPATPRSTTAPSAGPPSPTPPPGAPRGSHPPASTPPKPPKSTTATTPTSSSTAPAANNTKTTPVTTTSPDPQHRHRHAPPPERPARTPILTPPTHPPPTSRRTPPNTRRHRRRRTTPPPAGQADTRRRDRPRARTARRSDDAALVVPPAQREQGGLRFGCRPGAGHPHDPSRALAEPSPERGDRPGGGCVCT